jgi:DNA-binding MarR family transcriptional regulator
MDSSGKTARRARAAQEPAARAAGAASPDRLLSSLMRAADVWEGRIEAALDAVNLSPAKFLVLQQLAEANQPLPLSELAERCTCVRSNITQLVDRLESEGLVRRVDDPSDRRVIRARLTALGSERYAAGAKIVGDVESQLAAEVPVGERTALCDFLSRFC